MQRSTIFVCSLVRLGGLRNVRALRLCAYGAYAEADPLSFFCCQVGPANTRRRMRFTRKAVRRRVSTIQSTSLKPGYSSRRNTAASRISSTPWSRASASAKVSNVGEQG